MTLKPITNRDGAGRFQLPADGFVHLVPKGEFRHGESGLTQVLDDAALSAMAADFQREKALANAGGKLIDFDHFSYDTSKPSEAAGWIDDVQTRADGLWGKVRWSDTGEAALLNGRYRFISPVWYPDECEALDGTRVRPLRLDTAGLTNNPNLRGMTPLSNRGSSTRSSTAEETQAAKPNKQMKTIASKLGLAAEASEDAIISALTALFNRANTAEINVTTLTSERDVLKNRLTEVETEQIDADLDAHEVKDETKRGKLKPVLAAMKNRAERVDFLKLIGGDKPAETPTGKQPLTNRETAKTPADRTGATADKPNAEAQAKRAALVNRRAGELQKAKPGLSLMLAYQQAEQLVDSEASAGVAA